MNICCVIVTYNIGVNIIKTYESIKNQVSRIIFVDNNSIDKTQKILIDINSKDNKTESLFNDENYGIAKALNIGIKKALSDYDSEFILTLDHDSIADTDMISNMLEIFEKYKNKEKIGIISPAIFDINKQQYLTSVNKNEVQEIKEPIQSGSLITKKLFSDIGLYNEELVIYYVDTEFCYRALQSGYKMYQCNNVILKHEEGKKTKHKVLNKVFYYNNYGEYAVYYRARNNIYMIKNFNKLFTSKDRLLKDFVKILIFDKHKIFKLKIHFKGIFNGIRIFCLK